MSELPIPNPSLFPNATEAAAAMEEAGFEQVSDCGWEWDGMRQFFRIFWNPEERAVATVCLCEQSDVAFAPTLRCPPDIRWNHVPCGRNCFHQILSDHQAYLSRLNIQPNQLRVPDPEEIESSIENEMRKQVDHKLATGIIRLTGDGHFQYSKRGLVFLWGQFIKDTVRFC